MKVTLLCFALVCLAPSAEASIHALSGHYSIQESNCSRYAHANIFFDFLNRSLFYLILFEKETHSSTVRQIDFGLGGEGQLSTGRLSWNQEWIDWSGEHVEYLDSSGCRNVLKRSLQ